MSNDSPSSSRVAIVTGSSSGIGEAVARTLAARGCRVVVNSASSVADGERVAKEIGAAVYVQGDVSKVEDAARLVAAATEEFGRLDILVNNAGRTRVIAHSDIDAITDDVWHEILDVNIIGTWHMCQAAIPALREHGGSIVNVTSLAGTRQTGSCIPYAVSKAGLNHMTRLLAKVLGPDIRVNAVAPGLIATPWTSDWDEAHARVSEVAPMRRSGTPDDIAQAVAAVAENTYMTGEIIHVDGGMSLL